MATLSRVLRRPAEPGMTLAQVATPALLVDRDAMDANIAALADYLSRAAPGIRLRPHGKTQKSPDVARRQVAAGAIGVCCQTVAEAEAMAASGIADVLLSNQIADAAKAARVAALAGTCRMSVCVDDAAQVLLLSAAATAAGTILHVLVEVDVGGGRCGVGTPAAALSLATIIATSPGLTFDGLQAYHGRAQHLRSPEERREAIATASVMAAETAALIRRSGLSCDTITGAGTGTFEQEAASAVYTELQCGSYVFMDADYGLNLRDPADGRPFFRQSLTILTTVISVPFPERVVCDAGLKAMSLDSGPPSLARHPDLTFGGCSDEHTKMEAVAGAVFRPGDQLQLIPGHCDPTVAMHDWIVVHAEGIVTDLWPVARAW
jgi:D-serine deaminase-like pyridoxal phosphate-dependent protein